MTHPLALGLALAKPVKNLAAGMSAAPETLVTGGVKASGTFTFTANPSANHTISIDGVELTFVASSAAEDEITIGANLAATLNNIRTIIDAHSTLASLVSSADNDTSVVTVTAKRAGVNGNAIELASGHANAVVSAATLTGGVDGFVDLRVKTSILKPSASTAQTFYMEDGEEGQEHVFVCVSKGSGNAVINANGTTLLTFANAGETAVVQFLDGDWRVISETIA
jgi:hypothetical protein